MIYTAFTINNNVSVALLYAESQALSAQLAITNMLKNNQANKQRFNGMLLLLLR